MEIINQSPVKFTPGAVKEIKRILAKEKEGTYLRIGVKGGGCSGLTYVLGFEEKKENDTILEIDGIPCIMNMAHAIYLTNMEIDWEGGLNARGFTFNNPNASTSCGCGTSFAV